MIGARDLQMVAAAECTATEINKLAAFGPRTRRLSAKPATGQFHGSLRASTTRADLIPSRPSGKIASRFNPLAAFGQTGSLRAPTQADLIPSQPSGKIVSGFNPLAAFEKIGSLQANHHMPFGRQVRQWMNPLTAFGRNRDWINPLAAPSQNPP